VGRTVEEGVPRTDEAPLAAAPSPVWRVADVPTLATPELSLLPVTREATPVLDSASVSPLRPRLAGAAVLAMVLAVLVAGLGVLVLLARPESAPAVASAPPTPSPVAPTEAPPTPPQPAPTAPVAVAVPSPPPSAAPARPRVVALPRVEHLLPEPAPPPEPEGATPAPEPARPPPPESAPPAVEARPVPPAPIGTLVSVDPRSGSERVWVRTSEGLVVLPARLPGGTYTVLAADVAGHPQVAGSVEVPPSGAVAVRCAMGLCRGGG
jgi:hypothetical protein